MNYKRSIMSFFLRILSLYQAMATGKKIKKRRLLETFDIIKKQRTPKHFFLYSLYHSIFDFFIYKPNDNLNYDNDEKIIK